MLGHAELGSLSASRRTLLDEIGPTPDLTFIRGYGDLGNELIWEGTRRLLEGHVYREVDLAEMCSSEGKTALLGGGFSHASNEFMPEALAIAELRFERVIVLPSSFEVGEDRIREALVRSRATVFASEPESFRRIAGLCDARLAHDCAFYFDYSPYRERGAEGTLLAMRTDGERSENGQRPEGNDDISRTRATLEEWLDAIAAHERVVTNRADVMIAAALMGREVEYAPSDYFEVPALASTLPPGVRVQPLKHAPLPVPNAVIGSAEPPGLAEIRAAALAHPPAAAPAPPADATTPPRVSAVILSHQRPEGVARAVRSVLAAEVGVRVIVIDNNSGERTHQALRALARKHPEVDLHLIDRNLGCAGGRRFGVGLADGEFVLFLDDDAELMPGALDHLVADLDAHPNASAVTSLVVYPDGSVFYFGGRIEETARSVSFELGGYGLRFDDPALGATGPSGWAPGGAMLARAEVFDEVPIDEEMSVYYEDNDWCLRLEHARPASLRRCHEAIAVHPKVLRKPPGAPFLREAFIVRRLSAHARFLAKHGVLLETDLPDLLPELVRSDGTCDDGTVRLLLALIDSRGPVWTLMAWVGGELEPLLEPARYEFTRLNEELREARSEIEELEVAVAWLGQRADILAGVLAGGWWRLRGRLAPVLGPISRLRRRLKRRRSE